MYKLKWAAAIHFIDSDRNQSIFVASWNFARKLLSGDDSLSMNMLSNILGLMQPIWYVTQNTL